MHACIYRETNLSSFDCIEIRTHVTNVRRLRDDQLNHSATTHSCVGVYKQKRHVAERVSLLEQAQ